MNDSVCKTPDNAVEHLKLAERALDAAEAKVKAGMEALAEAQRDRDKAEKELKEAISEIENPRRFDVEVLYDGVKKRFEVRRGEHIKKLLDDAIHAFGPLPNPHMLSLYKDGKELPDTSTVEQAGIKPCDVLLLRPSTVKGGQ